MMFNGAADYFFWVGLRKGVNNRIENLPAMLNNKFHMDNATTRECLEAFEWGFYFGLQLTQDEYVELLKFPASVNAAEETLIKLNTTSKIQKNYNGNC